LLFTAKARFELMISGSRVVARPTVAMSTVVAPTLILEQMHLYDNRVLHW